jgi:hypothetical protein
MIFLPTIRMAHQLPRDEVRRRMAARAGDLHKLIPGGVGAVTHAWAGEDVMRLEIAAMGQSVAATATIEDAALAIDYALPPALGFFQPMVETVIRQAGDKLLLADGR